MSTNISNGFRHPLGDGVLTEAHDGDGHYVALNFDRFNDQIGTAGSWHLGEDWNGEGGDNTDLGDPVYAVGNGEVLAVVADQGASTQGFGNYVVIRHHLAQPITLNGLTVSYVNSLYAHLQTVEGLARGQTVAMGQQIGTLGQSGKTDGVAHLHFEITLGDVLPTSDDAYNPAGAPPAWVDPTDFIAAHRTLGGDGRGDGARLGSERRDPGGGQQHSPFDFRRRHEGGVL